jgi:Zn finger protein HypA/HybF involved in hydrogenase expression
MARIWVRSLDCGWQALPLPPTGWAGLAPGTEELVVGQTPGQMDWPVVLAHLTATPKDSWVLLAKRGAAVHVNGQRVCVGLAVLSDHDAIRIGGEGPVFFSTHAAATIEAFAPEAQPVLCARCQGAIQPGSASVRCPSCRAFHHQDQTEDLNCWTYDPICATRGCSQPTALTGDVGWSPQEI